MININPIVSVTGRPDPVTLSNMSVTSSKGTSFSSASNVQLGSPVTVTKSVTITPRFTANYSITPKERMNIITLHNQGDNSKVFTT